MMISSGPVEAVFYDGKSNAKRVVTLVFAKDLEIYDERNALLAAWPYDSIRRIDAGDGLLRLTLGHGELARLEIADSAAQQKLVAACPNLYGAGGMEVVSNRKIIAWSLAAAFSILAIIIYGLPFLASLLTPLIPYSWERRLGDAVANQTSLIFPGKSCTNPEGMRAFEKLLTALQSKAGLPEAPPPVVRDSPVANAFALPGGRVYLLSGLLARAENPDEIAGVLAHEMGHVAHRDGLRNMIEHGASGYLTGLLFGDIFGAGAAVALGRTLVDAHYSRTAESEADAFAIRVMTELGRSPKPMGQLLMRITGSERNNPLSVFASHPITAERVATFDKVNVINPGPEILSPQEWSALKAICSASQ